MTQADFQGLLLLPFARFPGGLARGGLLPVIFALHTSPYDAARLHIVCSQNRRNDGGPRLAVSRYQSNISSGLVLLSHLPQRALSGCAGAVWSRKRVRRAPGRGLEGERTKHTKGAYAARMSALAGHSIINAVEGRFADPQVSSQSDSWTIVLTRPNQ